MSSDADRTDPVLARKNAWHQSTLETLLDGCSWQYFLTYVMNLPQPLKPHSVVGTSFHSAVEAHEKARMNGVEDGISIIEMKNIAEELVRSQIDDDDLVFMVHTAVKHWYGAKMKDGGKPHRDYLMAYEPVSIEPYFNLPLVDGAKPVAGWIDGVYRHKETGQYTIVDQKTAGKLDRWSHDGEGHRYQATMYAVALALSPDFPEITDVLPMNYLISRTQAGKSSSFEGARRVVVVPDYEDVRVLGERIRKAEQIVQNEEYVRTPEWGLCSKQWCAFYDRCMVSGELAGTPQTIRIKLKEEIDGQNTSE